MKIVQDFGLEVAKNTPSPHEELWKMLRTGVWRLVALSPRGYHLVWLFPRNWYETSERNTHDFLWGERVMFLWSHLLNSYCNVYRVVLIELKEVLSH